MKDGRTEAVFKPKPFKFFCADNLNMLRRISHRVFRRLKARHRLFVNRQRIKWQRKLTPEQMDLARHFENRIIKIPSVHPLVGKTPFRTEIEERFESTHDGFVVRRRQYLVSDAPSVLSEQPIQVPEKTTIQTYDRNGLLISSTQTDFNGKKTTKVYRPAGRFIGKKIRTKTTQNP